MIQNAEEIDVDRTKLSGQFSNLEPRDRTMQETPIEKFREAFRKQRNANVPSTKGTFFDIDPSRPCIIERQIVRRTDSESVMDLSGEMTSDGPSVLDQLLTSSFNPNADRTKFPFEQNIWLAPYGLHGIPAASHLNVARAHEISCGTISFYFPLQFTRDLLAIRLGDGRRTVDLCGKIASQTTVETREFGPSNLVECNFVGRLFLG